MKTAFSYCNILDPMGRAQNFCRCQPWVTKRYRALPFRHSA